MEFTKAIVTGGSGFIGSHLVDALVSAGVLVTVIDREDPATERKNAQAVYVKMDIKDAGLRHAFQEAAPEVVFHLAAHIDDRESVRKPVMNAEENIIGSINVFEAARLAGAKKLVFASTGVLYGNADTIPTSEEVVPKPSTPYGVSKLSGERYLNFYWLLYKLPYVALRLSNVYGPRQDSSRECGAIAIFTQKLLKGETPVLNNDGRTTRDYIHVDDVVAAFTAAVKTEGTGVFNIGTSVETTTSALYAMVTDAVGVQATPTAGETQDAVKRCALNATKAQRELAWSPTIGLQEGIKKTVEWYRRQGV